MTEPTIEVHGLGKRYEIGQRRPQYDRMSERLMHAIRPTRGAPPEDSTLWALRDLDFHINAGETVGVVGRNGAGKSTLLKILSRVTKPTEGRATLRGRVGSLLEVGTGFHPELTGRENVMLNGAILGMRRSEVLGKLDEIVDFAGVERFMDTPVKRYSSGMYMRLAFAVAAHLETEILLVDEVLAVGDATFQNKSVGRMREAAAGGRTVLFVSHNTSAIANLCNRCLYLREGQLVGDGPTAQIMEEYLRQGGGGPGTVDLAPSRSGRAYYSSIGSYDAAGRSRGEFEFDEPIGIEFVLTVDEQVPGLYLTLLLRASDGTAVLMTEDRDAAGPVKYECGRYRFRVEIPPGLLAPGQYFVTVGAASAVEGRLDHRDGVLPFVVHDHERPRGNARLGVLGVTISWAMVEGQA